MSTNHDLARAAAEKIEPFLDLRDALDDEMAVDEVAKIITDTYAEKMAELERLNDRTPITRERLLSLGYRDTPAPGGLKYENHLAREGVKAFEHDGSWIFVVKHGVAMGTLGDFNRMMDWFDCPHNEVAT